MTSFVSFVTGLMFGSFANVVIHRIPQTAMKDDLRSRLGAGVASVIWPRSRCPACAAPIAAYDNVPLLSYLWLRGRCRSCKTRISERYPVVELLTGVLFWAASAKYGWGWELWVRDWPFIVLMISITFIDLEHRIIPDSLNLAGLVLACVTAGLDPDVGFWGAAVGAALGFGGFYAFARIYEALTGRAGMGGGDIKFMGFIGAFLGPLGVLDTMLVGSVLGSVIGLLWALVQRKGDPLREAIPFGPFLVLGALVHYFLGGPVWLRFMNPT